MKCTNSKTWNRSELVDWIISEDTKKAERQKSIKDFIGTGSGCIAVSLAKKNTPKCYCFCN
jgi:methylase of polypeptide subunit release factors